MNETLTPPDSPLKSHPVLTSTRFNEVRDAVNSFTCDEHEVVVQRARDVPAVVNGLQVDMVGLLFVRYGAEVLVEAPPTESRIVIAVPLGPMVVTDGTGRKATMTTPFVLHEDRPTLMYPDSTAGCLVGAIDRTHLEEYCSALNGDPRPKRLHFAPAAEVPRPSFLADTWINVCAQLDLVQPNSYSGAARRALAQTLMTAALLGLPHSAGGTFFNDQNDVGPSYLRAARKFLETNFASQLSISDLADAVGISVRQLHTAFQNHFNESPAQLLREIRLAHARRQLQAARTSGNGNVTQIALDSGFTHLGRFSAYYTSKYGEAPSETLRGRRADEPCPEPSSAC
ncbi:AraC family transcriptional regulator [Streptomyces shenzhenensis]|uniref:helix-turn-helix transcriptional regulator n=1 Tax=Streptomyces shenzhenensis TaxID=943815 RepID=UPI0037F29DCA